MPEEIDTNNMSAEEIAELQKQNCIFCKIIQKQIPAKILHEDDEVLCVLDINPVSEGHILVIPKEHYMILPHVPDTLLAHLFKTVKLMSNTLIKSLQCRATSVFIANGMAAGQKAPHVLIHVFPRREDDGLLELPKYEMNEEQSEKLKKTLHPYLIQLFGKVKTEITDSPIVHERVGDDETHKTKDPNRHPEKTHDKDGKENVINHDKEDITDHNREKKDHNKEGVKGQAKEKHSKDDTKNKKIDLDDIARLFGG